MDRETHGGGGVYGVAWKGGGEMRGAPNGNRFFCVGCRHTYNETTRRRQ